MGRVDTDIRVPRSTKFGEVSGRSQETSQCGQGERTGDGRSERNKPGGGQKAVGRSLRAHANFIPWRERTKRDRGSTICDLDEAWRADVLAVYDCTTWTLVS